MEKTKQMEQGDRTETDNFGWEILVYGRNITGIRSAIQNEFRIPAPVSTDYGIGVKVTLSNVDLFSTELL